MYEARIKEYRAGADADSTEVAAYDRELKYLRDSMMGRLRPWDGDTIQCHATLPKPQQVGIIVNYSVQSASEMLLLDMQRSSKVKVFGERTMGAVDQVDYEPIATPSGKYWLYISFYKRMIPPGGAPVDGRGIAPDVLLSDSDPDWVETVRKYYQSR